MSQPEPKNWDYFGIETGGKRRLGPTNQRFLHYRVFSLEHLAKNATLVLHVQTNAGHSNERITQKNNNKTMVLTALLNR